MTQTQMILLFERDQSVISRHINNAFKEEVDVKSNMHFLHIANSDKPVKCCELMHMIMEKIHGSLSIFPLIDSHNLLNYDIIYLVISSLQN